MSNGPKSTKVNVISCLSSSDPNAAVELQSNGYNGRLGSNRMPSIRTTAVR